MELGSFPEVGVCLQTSFFPCKNCLAPVCLGRGRGEREESRALSSFPVPVPPKRCFSVNRRFLLSSSHPIPQPCRTTPFGEGAPSQGAVICPRSQVELEPGALVAS